MPNHHLLTILSPLSNLEMATLLALLSGLFILFYDLYKKRHIKKQRAKMLERIVHIKKNKWEDIINILTTPTPLDCQDIQKVFQKDLKIFDRKYRDILYHELVKIKKQHNVNPDNWKLLVGIVYNGNSKVR